MFDRIVDAFGDDPRFAAMVREMFNDIVLNVNNDLKFGKMNLDDGVFKGIIATIFEDYTFELLRTINLVQNGSDAEKMGNVNDFINDLESIYYDGKDMMETEKLKTYGGK